jgi:hypothetical protein
VFFVVAFVDVVMSIFVLVGVCLFETAAEDDDCSILGKSFGCENTKMIKIFIVALVGS